MLKKKDSHPGMTSANETGRKAAIMFTQDQYEQLMKLINKDNVTDGENVTSILHSFLSKHNIDYFKWNSRFRSNQSHDLQQECS